MYKFELDEKQIKKLVKWQKKQKETYAGAIGGAYTYCFTPTGLGDCIVVKCINGNEIDLTDSDSW